MKTTIQLDTVLDLVHEAQMDLAELIDTHMNGTSTYRVLWGEYKRLSGLCDDIRRAANDD